jgi:hypothetical protein
VDPECLSGDSGGRLLHSISRTNNFRATGKLIENGANINFVPYDEHHRRDGTPLYQAVSSREPGMVRLLLDNRADPNIHCYRYIPTAILKAVFTTNPLMEIVDLLLQYGADIKCSVLEQDLLDYVSVKDRDIYRFILDKMGGTVASVIVGDILEAAHRGSRPLLEYLSHHHRSVTQKQLEKALYESINLSGYGISATLALLEYSVDPNGLTLDDPPLMVAVLADQEKAIRVS